MKNGGFGISGPRVIKSKVCSQNFTGFEICTNFLHYEYDTEYFLNSIEFDAKNFSARSKTIFLHNDKLLLLYL